MWNSAYTRHVKQMERHLITQILPKYMKDKCNQILFYDRCFYDLYLLSYTVQWGKKIAV